MIAGPSTERSSAASGTIPTHDKAMAAEFVTVLDPAASKFTFQFFCDSGSGHAQVFHGSVDEVWPRVEALNTPTKGMGVFVTVNETDGQGRRRDNIIRVRALFADADNSDQRGQALEVLRETRVIPTMVVQTSRDRTHIYFCCDGIPLSDSSAYQTALADKLGTDPAVKDLPRVMRLPGTLHLKDPGRPQKVILKKSSQLRRYRINELTSALDLRVIAGPGSPKKVTTKSNRPSAP
jgi:hypothetical protein